MLTETDKQRCKEAVDSELDGMHFGAAAGLERRALEFREASEWVETVLPVMRAAGDAAEMAADPDALTDVCHMMKGLAALFGSPAAVVISDHADALIRHGVITACMTPDGRTEQASAHHVFLDLLGQCHACLALDEGKGCEMVTGLAEIARGLRVRLQKERMLVLGELEALIRNARANLSIPYAEAVE
jgi:hypothetical protein